MPPSPSLRVFPLGFPWQTLDPFLFCVHHLDHYPEGNQQMGPARSLAGRNLGMDFEIKDGWRMYHGHEIPGFPRHPHRGFETVTLARRGYIDHSDSLGATARFGQGDVQWMTAGRGIVHSEMFPLVRTDAANPVELFQIWLNLPRSDKLVDPYFTMLWSSAIPQLTFLDAEGRASRVTVVAGSLDGRRAPSPPPHSWASRPESDVAIWSLSMEPGATWRLPEADPGTNRVLYFFSGSSLSIEEQTIGSGQGVVLAAELPLALSNGETPGELLLLQGRPLQEPVAQHGPFVMNTAAEIRQAFLDYQETGFGGWPWSRDDPVHSREAGRFAIHADGRREAGR